MFPGSFLAGFLGSAMLYKMGQGFNSRVGEREGMLKTKHLVITGVCPHRLLPKARAPMDKEPATEYGPTETNQILKLHEDTRSGALP